MRKPYDWMMEKIGDPVFMRAFNGWATLFWLVMIIPSLVLGWVDSVVYVSALSLWALVSGHWAAWQAARVEVRQAEQEEQEEARIEKMVSEIVDRLKKEEIGN
ncbi:membrane protein [Microbacterium phage Pumpernickel]|uniref:Membrane protein n=1 Tax=Microbacterium phage Pumpernickel TaxID=2885983 RepID=A0AAE8Y8E2_9CAUD|nr:membrane protein [Microbacterium phage Pumpernickel]UDL15928.1 membrane protein [Microbacterium phage Pumpernickel]